MTALALVAILAQPPVVRLDVGAPAPFAGRLVVDEAWLQIGREMAAADEVIPRLEVALDACRVERDEAQSKAAAVLDAAAVRVGDVARDLAPAEAPSRPLWASLGAGASVACGVAAFVFLDASETARGVGAGLAAAGCGGVVVGLAGAFE